MIRISLPGWGRADVLTALSRAFGRVEFDFNSLTGCLSEAAEKQLLLDLRNEVERCPESAIETDFFASQQAAQLTARLPIVLTQSEFDALDRALSEGP